MTRLISFLGFGIAAAALPQMAAAQSVTLDPGLYEVSEKVVMTFRPEKNKVEDVCISAGQNIKTLEGLIEAFTKRKDECQPRDIQQTGSTLRANFTCPSLPSGGDVGGTVEAEYGTNRLNYTIDIRFGPVSRVTVTTNMRRTGECS